MFTHFRLIASGAVIASLLAALAWGGFQQRRAANLSDRLDAAEARAAGAERAVQAMQNHMTEMRRQAEAADLLRNKVKEKNDATPLPDWLADVLGSLRAGADHDANP